MKLTWRVLQYARTFMGNRSVCPDTNSERNSKPIRINSSTVYGEFVALFRGLATHRHSTNPRRHHLSKSFGQITKWIPFDFAYSYPEACMPIILFDQQKRCWNSG